MSVHWIVPALLQCCMFATISDAELGGVQVVPFSGNALDKEIVVKEGK